MRNRLPISALCILVIAGFAALVSRDCIGGSYGGVDPAVHGDGNAEAAAGAVLSAAVASSIALSFALFAYKPRRLIILVGTSIAAYGGVLATKDATSGGGLEGLVLLPMIPIGGWAAIVFFTAGSQLRSLGVAFVSGMSAWLGWLAIIIGVLANYEICIGFFGTTCPEPEPVDIFPFALIAGGVPPLLAAVAARFVGDWYRPPRDADDTKQGKVH